MPGGGQFHLGQTAAGLGYAAGTLGTVGWAAAANQAKSPGEFNAPVLYAQQIYVLSLYSAFRDLGLNSPSRSDPSPTRDLLAAPFRAPQLTSPWVVGSLLVGVGAGLALGRLEAPSRNFGDVARLKYLGGTFNRDQGAAVYGAYWIPLSFGAGVSEEALFRGMFQADFEDRWGPAPGLWTASALFGLAHLRRLNDPESWAQVGFATAAGAFLGWRYQRKDYKLAEPIACHFWYDVGVGLALFFADPEDNPLGARLEFRF